MTMSDFMESSKVSLRDKAACHVRSELCSLRLVLTGVFMMVAGGIVAGVVLIFVEIAYKRHRGLKDKELELARNAADRWRGNIEVCLCAT